MNMTKKGFCFALFCVFFFPCSFSYLLEETESMEMNSYFSTISNQAHIRAFMILGFFFPSWLLSSIK